MAQRARESKFGCMTIDENWVTRDRRVHGKQMRVREGFTLKSIGVLSV